MFKHEIQSTHCKYHGINHFFLTWTAICSSIDGQLISLYFECSVLNASLCHFLFLFFLNFISVAIATIVSTHRHSHKLTKWHNCNWNSCLFYALKSLLFVASVGFFFKTILFCIKCFRTHTHCVFWSALQLVGVCFSLYIRFYRSFSCTLYHFVCHLTVWFLHKCNVV